MRPKNAFYEIEVGFANNLHAKLKDNFNGRYVMAYGFIDNDKFNDVVVINQKRNAFAVYFYEEPSTMFTINDMMMVD